MAVSNQCSCGIWLFYITCVIRSRLEVNQLENKQFEFAPFSKKQYQVLTWWLNPEFRNKKAIFCDGSIRSGKTLIMSLSYVMWSMYRFNDTNFGFAGRSIGSLRKNVLRYLKKMLYTLGYQYKENKQDSMLIVSRDGHTNYYYLYGGDKETSADTVQGLTAAGFFFDEVTVLNETFVRECIERTASFKNAKLWFNCNPDNPYSFAKREILDRPDAYKLYHLHFLMKDNPVMDDEQIEYFRNVLTGAAYQRDFLGKWVIANGLVYSNFDENTMVTDCPPLSQFRKYVVSADYGAQNPTTFLLWGYHGIEKRWYCIREYYYDNRQHYHDKTDQEYCDDMDKFLGNIPASIILDPAAQNFAIALMRRGYKVLKANKDVFQGIRLTQIRMNEGRIKFTHGLKNVFRELHSYMWDEKKENKGIDAVVKSHDHCMDAIRYFVARMLPPNIDKKDNGVQFFKEF